MANFPRMQCTRAISITWLISGLCPNRPKCWIPIKVIIFLQLTVVSSVACLEKTQSDIWWYLPFTKHGMTSHFLCTSVQRRWLWCANGDLEIVLYELIALTVLITDGMSETDGTPAADVLKKVGNPIFAIGIDSQNNLLHLEALSSPGDNGIKHFFHITSYEALENIGKYLNRKWRYFCYPWKCFFWHEGNSKSVYSILKKETFSSCQEL